MSVLTKICVVILVAGVLVSVPIFITQATVGPSWKTAYEKQAKYITVVKMRASSVQLALRQANTLAEKRLDELNAMAIAMKTAVDGRDVELASLRSINASQGIKLANLAATLDNLEKTLKIEVGRQIVYEGLLKTARLEYDHLKTSSLRMENKFRENQAESQRFVKVNEHLREQLAENAERIKNLEEALTTGVGMKKRVPEEPPRIDGTITTVRKDIVGINLGSAKGVKSGMKLIIHRGKQFVGYVRIQEVGIEDSAGTVFGKYPGIEPMKGDKVTTTLRR